MLEKAYERGRRYAKQVPIMAIFDAYAKPDPRACKSMTSFIKTRGANYYLSDENREIEEFLVTRFCALKKGDKPKRSLQSNSQVFLDHKERCFFFSDSLWDWDVLIKFMIEFIMNDLKFFPM